MFKLNRDIYKLSRTQTCFNQFRKKTKQNNKKQKTCVAADTVENLFVY